MLRTNFSPMKILKTCLLLAGLAGISLLPACSRSGPEPQPGAKPRPVVMAEVELRDLSVRRTVAAPVVAYRRVYVNARTTGQILELQVEEGDQVRQGQRLLRIDTRQQEAQLRQARAAAVEARLQHQRNQQLFDSLAISAAELELATRQLEEAESQVEFWAAEVEYGEVRATVDGVIAARFVELGSNVSAHDRLFTVEDHDLLVIRSALPELDVIHLEPGQAVDLQFDVFEDAWFSGTVRRIFPSADPLTRLFTVEVQIDQTQTAKPIRPGYLARVHFTTIRHPDAVVIPPECIARTDSADHAFVIREDLTLARQPLTTGIEREGWIEVIAGLQPGQRVVAGNTGALREDQAVEIIGTFRRHGFGQ